MVQSKFSPADALRRPGRSAPTVQIAPPARRTPCFLASIWDFMPDAGERWQSIKVPSFWGAVEQFDHPENWKEVHTAFYAARFSLPLSGSRADLGDDRVFLCFDGVSTVCDVILNGCKAGEHGGKFTPFELDVTALLRDGDNELCLVVGDMTHALDETGRALLHQVGLMRLGGHMPDPFMPDHQFFGGIWQPVWLERRPAFRVERARIVTSVRARQITVHFTLTGAANEPCEVRPLVTDRMGVDARVAFHPFTADGAGDYTLQADWPQPKLWSVGEPNLYELHLSLYCGGTVRDSLCVRFGFREFWIEGERFYLNGTPVKLFGESVNMSQQMLCSNHRKDYMRLLYRTMLERAGINCVRLHSMIAPRAMIEAADETGMLLIDQSAVWSSASAYYARADARLLANLRQEWAEWIWRDINSPAVVIWDAENEQLRGARSNRWTLELDAFFNEHDPTRPVEHSGAGGFEKRFALYHIHHNEQYAYLLDLWESERDKPLVIGEWWIGGRAGMPRNITGRDHKDYGAFVRDMAELYRARIIELRLRGAGGIMPYNFIPYLFEPVFDYRQRAALPDDGAMQPCPDFLSPYSDVAGMGKELCNPGWDPMRPSVRLNADLERAFSSGFAPAAAFFTQRGLYIEAGTQTRVVRVLNDSPSPRALTLRWEADCCGERLGSGECRLTLEPGSQADVTAAFTVPDNERDLAVSLAAKLYEGDAPLHSDSLPLLALSERAPTAAPVLLYDPDGATAALFEKLGIARESAQLGALPTGSGRTLVIGARVNDAALRESRAALAEFAEQGGRILVLEQQSPAPWLPVAVGFQSCELQTSCDYLDIGSPTPTNRGVHFSRYFTVYAHGHPLFEGVPDTVCAFSGGDGRVVDDVYIKPVAEGETGLQSLCVLSGGTKQNQASALEYFAGGGCWLLLQYKLCENAEHDPMARRLLYNALAYLGSNAARRHTRPAAAQDQRTAERFERRYGLRLPHTGPLPEGGVLFIGGEERWDPALQSRLEPWIRAGGTAVLLPRPAGELAVFGNVFQVAEGNLLSNGLYVRPLPITWGMHGTDLEAECRRPVLEDSEDPRFPVRCALLAPNAPYASRRIAGDPFEPVIELVNRQQTAWWYFAPNHSCGDAAVLVRHGKGAVLLWQLEPFGENAFSAHFTRALLLNLGLPFPPRAEKSQTLRVFQAREQPLGMDLEKWICDMDDLNLRRNERAEPMLLTADMALSGAPRDNADVSAAVYLMTDRANLFLMAQVADDQVCPGGDAVSLRFGDRAVTVTLQEEGALAFTAESGPVTGCAGRWARAGDAEFRLNRDARRIVAGISNPYFTGYRLECALPLELLGLRNVKEAPLRLTVRDEDGDGRAPSLLCWPGPLESEARVLFETEMGSI